MQRKVEILEPKLFNESLNIFIDCYVTNIMKHVTQFGQESVGNSKTKLKFLLRCLKFQKLQLPMI